MKSDCVDRGICAVCGAVAPSENLRRSEHFCPLHWAMLWLGEGSERYKELQEEERRHPERQSMAEWEGREQ